MSPPPSSALSIRGTHEIYIFKCAINNNKKMDLECMHDTCISLFVFIHHSFHTEVIYIKMPFSWLVANLNPCWGFSPQDDQYSQQCNSV